MPSSAAATTQPIDSAPWPTWPHEVISRREFGPGSRALWVGAEHAGNEADVSTGAFRIFEGLHPAQAAHQYRKRLRLGLPDRR